MSLWTMVDDTAAAGTGRGEVGDYLGSDEGEKSKLLIVSAD
jgi:hypothetical protein